jgi:hypothetical protein
VIVEQLRLTSITAGFQINGLAGVLGNIGGALTSAPSMPNLARRLWLMSRKSNLEKKDGTWKLVNLGMKYLKAIPPIIYSSLTLYIVGADNIDVGNYSPGEGFAHAVTGKCAAEFGEDDVRRDLLKNLDENLHPIVDSPTGNGAIMSGGLSILGMGYAYRARIAKMGDWADLINCPIDTASLSAPKLNHVPFPEILVAQCYAYESTGLDFVLRGSPEERPFTVELKDLEIGSEYAMSVVDNKGAKTVVAPKVQGDADGVAQVTIPVGDRAVFELRMVRDI